MIAAIVLAAGRSERMGRQKLLLPFGGKTVITHIIDQLRASSANEVIAVVGQDKQVTKEISPLSVSIVTNPDPQAEMLSSIRCGLRALPPSCETILVALGDQPSIRTALVDELLRAFARTPKGILLPLHDGRRGHPIMFATKYTSEIMTHYNDVGLRGLLHAHPEDICELPVSSSSVLSDMDYPEDYRRELSNLKEPSQE